ncbi:MAG: peptidoglycan-binding domain-containing protein [Clostridia bacterium]|nr:peptidoglycan-binding domain-containing protein [Clostridia bacterium]
MKRRICVLAACWLCCFAFVHVKAEVMLRRGDHTDVSLICSIQDRLEQLGYYAIHEDRAGYGSVSNATLEALKAFCMANGLEADEEGVTAEAYEWLMNGEPVAREDAVLTETTQEHALLFGDYEVQAWIMWTCAFIVCVGAVRCVWIVVGPHKRKGRKASDSPAARGHPERRRRSKGSRISGSVEQGIAVNVDQTTGTDEGV